MTTGLFRAASPVLAVRAVHLDLKGLPPEAGRLIDLLKIFSLARYNAVLVEWEDTFPWETDRRFRGETYYEPDTVRAFCSAAARLDIELIPLVQCIGHMETPLQIDDYAPLREIEACTDTLNPLAPGARELVQSMVNDVLTLMPGVRCFHLGGDEAWHLGENPHTKAFIDKHGKPALYLQHVEPLLDGLHEQGKRPILWHDMMIDWPPDALARLGAKADLMIWGYQGTPDNATGHHRRVLIERMAGAGVPLWGAGAFKCSEGLGSNVPVAEARRQNMLGWAKAAPEFGLIGVCAAGFTRFHTPHYQFAPMDAALDVLIETGVILHDGEPPEGGLEACIEALNQVGEAESFRRRKQAAREFDETSDVAWVGIRATRQFLANLEADPTRRVGGLDRRLLAILDNCCGAAEKAGEALRPHFVGCVPAVWVDRLVKSRTLAIAREHEELKCELRKVVRTGAAG